MFKLSTIVNQESTLLEVYTWESCKGGLGQGAACAFGCQESGGETTVGRYEGGEGGRQQEAAGDVEGGGGEGEQSNEEGGEQSGEEGGASEPVLEEKRSRCTMEVSCQLFHEDIWRELGHKRFQNISDF